MVVGPWVQIPFKPEIFPVTDSVGLLFRAVFRNCEDPSRIKHIFNSLLLYAVQSAFEYNDIN